MKKENASAEIVKSKTPIPIEYKHSMVKKNIIKKKTGHLAKSSFAVMKDIAEKAAPSSIAHNQKKEGKAEISILDKLFVPKLGYGKIIPAHAKHHFNVNE